MPTIDLGKVVGPAGAAAQISGASIGTVQTLPAGSSATAGVTAGGSAGNRSFTFDFGIPQGAKGDTGAPGADALHFTGVAVRADTGDIADISDAAITADHVLARCEIAAPVYITGNLAWRTAAGHFYLNGTCTAATTAQVTLVKKGN